MPSKPPHSIVLPALIALTLATGGVLFGLAQLLVTGPAPSAEHDGAPSANLEVIRAFYTAANRTLNTGNPAELDSLIAPDFVDHRSPSGSVSGREGLIRALVSLHVSFPRIQLAVDDLVAQADEVVARVHLTGVAPGQFAGLVPPAFFAVWGEIDLFRLADGVILEHWGGQESAAEILPLQHSLLALSYPRNDFSARRLTFNPASAYQSNTWNGPQLVYVESGQLAVTISPSYTAQQDPAVQTHASYGGSGHGNPIDPGHAVVLGQGDLLALPQGIYFSVEVGEGGPVTCLQLALEDFAPFVAEKIDGPRVQRLVDNVPGPMPSGSVAVTLGAVTLAPGAFLQVKTASGSTLVAVDSGRLDLTMMSGGAWTQSAVDGSALAVGSLSQALLRTPVRDGGGSPGSQRRGAGMAATMTFPPATTLGSGDAALVEAGASGVIRNVGDTPVSLLVVGLTPDPSATGTPVPRRTGPMTRGETAGWTAAGRSGGR